MLKNRAIPAKFSPASGLAVVLFNEKDAEDFAMAAKVMPLRFSAGTSATSAFIRLRLPCAGKSVVKILLRKNPHYLFARKSRQTSFLGPRTYAKPSAMAG